MQAVVSIGEVNGIPQANYIAVKDNHNQSYLIPFSRYSDWQAWRGSALNGDDARSWNVPVWAKMYIVFRKRK